MSGTVGVVVAAALAATAAAQLVVAAVLLVAARRALTEVRDLRGRLQETLAALDAALAHTGSLAAEAEGTLRSARQFTEHAAALARAGRALAEGSVGRLLLRRLLPKRWTGAGAEGGEAGAAWIGKLAVGLAWAVWQALRSRPARPAAGPAAGQSAGSRDGRAPRAMLGVGPIRRLDAAAAPGAVRAPRPGQETSGSVRPDLPAETA
jgi:hypothetical protein